MLRVPIRGKGLRSWSIWGLGFAFGLDLTVSRLPTDKAPPNPDLDPDPDPNPNPNANPNSQPRHPL